MLAVGRALLMDPSCCIVDEMSLGLAPVIVAGAPAVVASVAADTGCGVLLVEQHVQLALEIADVPTSWPTATWSSKARPHGCARDRSLLESSYLGDRVLPS